MSELRDMFKVFEQAIGESVRVPKEFMTMTELEKSHAETVIIDYMDNMGVTTTTTKPKYSVELEEVAEFKPFAVICLDNPDEMGKHFEKGIEYMCLGIDTIHQQLLVVDMNGKEVLVNAGFFMKVKQKKVEPPATAIGAGDAITYDFDQLKEITEKWQEAMKFKQPDDLKMTFEREYKATFIDPPDIPPKKHYYTKPELDEMLKARDTAFEEDRKAKEEQKKQEKVVADRYLAKYRELKDKEKSGEPADLSKLAMAFLQANEDVEKEEWLKRMRDELANEAKKLQLKRDEEYLRKKNEMVIEEQKRKLKKQDEELEREEAEYDKHRIKSTMEKMRYLKEMVEHRGYGAGVERY